MSTLLVPEGLLALVGFPSPLVRHLHASSQLHVLYYIIVWYITMQDNVINPLLEDVPEGMLL